ncbi:uncharacterized protein YegJ (DUF2314 family) [Aquabacterium commune]|uniref:Uncharacterized protein YegJ (DUF2314 family) n=1 Tax=Aquabacterium commune TaxID=70586 RepID=A0A4R6R8F4_9BURK|nr:DUF2314 domain-containing protein [Aquabacterium commune]TDP82212.1 uncharacterized protein YegJ (DUF2314 family) [Aquabacterium commune]
MAQTLPEEAPQPQPQIAAHSDVVVANGHAAILASSHITAQLPMRLSHTLAATLALFVAPSVTVWAPLAHAADAVGTPAQAPAAKAAAPQASGPNAAATNAAMQILAERQKKAREEAAKRQEAVVEIDERDPAMRAAFKQAQDTLDDFLKIAASGDPKLTTVSMRVAIREGKRKEFIWITPFEAAGKGAFKGRVDNAPTLLKGVKEGQEWRFQRRDVVDWMYVDASKRTMHGNRTTCVQLSKAPPAEVEQIKRSYGLDCQAR